MKYPSRKQLLLLQALCASDQDFRRLWRSWKKQAGDYRHLDGGSLDLFCFAYTRLVKLLPHDTWLKVARNSYYYHWLHNTLLLQTATQVIQKLKKYKIEAHRIKGIFWISRYHEGDGARKMEDIDLYVTPAQVERAIHILEADGWVASTTETNNFHPKFAHALTLTKNKLELDLHCQMFYLFRRGKGQKEIMQTDAYHLIQACVNGIEWSKTPNLRWVIDVIQIIKTGNVDWHQFMTLVSEKRVALPVYAALSYIKSHFTLDIPRQVLTALRTTPTDYVTRRIFEINAKGPNITRSEILENYFWIYWQSVTPKWNPITWVVTAITYFAFRLRGRAFA